MKFLLTAIFVLVLSSSLTGCAGLTVLGSALLSSEMDAGADQAVEDEWGRIAEGKKIDEQNRK